MLNRNHVTNVSRKLAAALGLAVVSMLILATVIGATRVVATNANNPKQQIARAWDQAIDIGRYEFHTTVLQTLHPTLRLENVGRTARTEKYTINGEMDQPAERMLLQMQIPNQPPLDLKVEAGQAFGRRDTTSEWSALDADTDIFAPGGDPLGFLVAARNVTIVVNTPGQNAAADEFFPAGLIPPEMADGITRYQFDLSGLEYARYMRTQAETHLRERGELPDGVTLQNTQLYVDMQGRGELWVSESGLPVRQIVRMEFPPEAGARDWIEAEITTSYANWDQRAVEQLSFDWGRPVASLGNWLAANVSPKDLKRASANLTMFLIVACFAA
ncbi:MAG: hypothetical protein GY832_11990 [Chloroflexi bacterium]|nr:hypothetical protein [Chloroflexota bacterium]